MQNSVFQKESEAVEKALEREARQMEKAMALLANKKKEVE